MFPSSNFFRGLDCPEFGKSPGYCKRPYCHFRHIRTGTQEEDAQVPGQIPGYTSLTPKDVSYKALPSVPKPSRPPSMHRHHHDRDRRRRGHRSKTCKPQTQFSYVPTPITQLSRQKSEEPAYHPGGGVSTSSMEYDPGLPSKPAGGVPTGSKPPEYEPAAPSLLGASVGMPGGILNLTSLPGVPQDDRLANMPAAVASVDGGSNGVGLPSDETGLGMNPIKGDSSLAMDNNVLVDDGDECGLVVDETLPEASPLEPKTALPDSSQYPAESLSLRGSVTDSVITPKPAVTLPVTDAVTNDPSTASGSTEDFVALQKEEISRIESQLAELARKKALAEQSIAKATGGKLDKAAERSDPAKPGASDLPSPTFMPDPSVDASLTYSHDASTSGGQLACQGLDGGSVKSSTDMQVDQQPIGTSNIQDIKAFIQHVRRKSNENQDAAPPSTYEPNSAESFDLDSSTASDSLSFNGEALSDPEGTFSSDDDEDFDLPSAFASDEEVEFGEDMEEGETHVKSVDSGFSELIKVPGADGRDMTGKGNKIRVKQEKQDDDLTSRKPDTTVDRVKVEKMDEDSVAHRITKEEKTPKEGKTIKKERGMEKIRIKQEKDTEVIKKGDCKGAGHKRKLSAGELSSFYEKKKSRTAKNLKTKSGSSPEIVVKTELSESGGRNAGREVSKVKKDNQVKKFKQEPSETVKPSEGKSSTRGDDFHSPKPLNQGEKNNPKTSGKSTFGEALDTPTSPRKVHIHKTSAIKRGSGKSPKITKKVGLGVKAATIPRKEMSKKKDSLNLSADNTKRKFSLLFGESSDESDGDDAVILVPRASPDKLAISSDSDTKRKLKTGSSLKNAKVYHHGKKSSTKKDVFSLSSDSGSNKESRTEPQKSKPSIKSEPTPKQKLNMKVDKNVGSPNLQRLQKLKNLKPAPDSKSKASPSLPSRKATQSGLFGDHNGMGHELSDSDDEIIFITDDIDGPINEGKPQAAREKELENHHLDSRATGLSTSPVLSKQPSVKKDKQRAKQSLRSKGGGSPRGEMQQKTEQPEAVASSSDEDDFVPVEDVAVDEELFCDSDDLQDEDAYEECLQIFKENWNLIPPAEQKKKVLEVQEKANLQGIEGESIQSIKRQAHTPKFDTKRVRKLNKRTAPLPTPAQVCHKRFMAAQEAALKRQKEEEEEESQRRIEEEVESRMRRDEEKVREKAQKLQRQLGKLREEQSQRQKERMQKIREDQAWKRKMEQPSRTSDPPQGMHGGSRPSSSGEKLSQRRREEEWQRLREEQEHKRKGAERREGPVKSASKRRISHGATSEKGNKPKSSSSGSKPTKKQKTLAMTAGKEAKRTAHIPSKVSKRPVLPTEYGSKIPTNVRQRYLNLFIDELLKTCKTDQAAFDKALDQEREIYGRASSKGIYLNLSVNAIKRLRSDGSQPTTPTLNPHAMSHQAILGGKAATLTTYTLHKNTTQALEKLEGAVLYQKLQPYLASEEDLVENGYPRPGEEKGKAVAKPRKEKKQSSDPNQHVCCRCGKTFLRRPNGKYITKEQCVHHWGKLWTKRVSGGLESRYSCCAGDVQASGCGVAKLHVTDDKLVSSGGFMTTMVKSPPPDGNPGVFALDCEMCYTTLGIELTRVTIINDKLERVYDSLVKPLNDVVDYNTKFSGITEEDLETVKTTLQNVQAVLLSMFSSETILIGHSLESDLLALKLIHSTVIDTALVFPHRRGLPYKRALRTLTAEYLQKLIQDDESGHDSMEDAASCMELMIYRIKQDSKLKHH